MTDLATVATAAALPADDVLQQLGVTSAGLSSDEARLRLTRYGPNAISTHRARFWVALRHQLGSPLLGLLMITAVVSYFIGEQSNAIIIGVIVLLSVTMGFGNEYRAERAAEALHSQIRHRTAVLRDGCLTDIEVVELVPGDVVELRLGDIVPGDIRLLEVVDLECDESMLTGESMPVEKTADAVPSGTGVSDLVGCALMGTIVHSGRARGVVVCTGTRSEFGKIASGLSTHLLETEFQAGLRRFSMLLVYVAAVLTTSIFLANVVLHRPVIDSLLFSLAIAVGITPQLLPAVVSTSLAAGAHQMSRRRVLVKRLVCIEDLGDIDLLFTDKTGTLTDGRISFMRALGADRHADVDDVLMWGLLSCDVTFSGGDEASGATAVSGNQLDLALWNSPVAKGQRAAQSYRRVAVLPFDHQRRLTSVLVADAEGNQTLVTKGAPEAVLDRCADVATEARAMLDAEFAAGHRVVAVARRQVHDMATVTSADEANLTLLGLLVFLDAPKREAAPALRRLAELGVDVKIVTGDSAVVAAKVCQDLGLTVSATLTGAQIDELDDAALIAAIEQTTIFARVGPEQKARLVRVRRHERSAVAFLGDGVNDALALHAADVGISVNSATEVAKDAADVILLEKDLGVLADGIVEGRRIFANTIKYVLMGTSSNFGNMFSAAGASLFLTFLPMLPSQILLNNLLYDSSQLAIPTDNVDEEQLRRPSHWDIRFIRRFMLCFGPISSLFDFATFGIMLGVLHAGHDEFRTGWFVESLATQTLIIFAIRTRRVPFFRSTPSLPMTLAALGVVAVGALLPMTSLAHALGFRVLPAEFFLALVLMVISYLVLIESGKRWFYGAPSAEPAARPHRHTRRRAAFFAGSGPTGPGKGLQRLTRS